MKRLFSSHLPFVVEQMKHILESHHIACVTRNAYLGGGAGELPPQECWPELWVLENWQWPQAKELLDAFEGSVARGGPEWTCGFCGERIEGQFGSCWQCGQDRPGEATPREPA